MKTGNVISLFIAATALFAVPAQAELYITVVKGLDGLPEYGQRFENQTEQIESASQAFNGAEHVTTFSGEEATREAVLAHMGTLKEAMTEEDRSALYLIGHGSFDGVDYKFNIPGTDISANDLVELYDGMPGSYHLVVSTSSASGAMLQALEATENEKLILISATKNGNERNATEFGTYFAEALSSPEADINKNSRITIQEAFDFTERKVADFYESDDKLATEHPQLRGEQTDTFNIGAVIDTLALANVEETPKIAELSARSLEIDQEIEELQLRRENYSASEYTTLLRELILESAQVMEELESLENGGGSDD